MTWFLQPRDPEAMPPLPGDLPSAGEQFVEGARNEYLAIDSWALGERAANDLRQEMLGALGGFEAIGPTLTPEERPLMRSPETMTEVLLSRIGALPVGSFPKSREEFDAEVIRRRNVERDESDEMLARGDAPVTQFAGRMTGALSDPASIMTLFLGGEAQIGRLGRFVMAEVAAGATGEVPAVIQERQVARDLGREEPGALDAALQIGLGAAGGGAFGGAIAGGVRLLDYIRVRREGESAASGNRSPLEHEADIDAAERALRRGEEPPAPRRPADRPTASADDPPGWDQIRNGIFAGESGGDYDALFGYQNRTGGEFANVRLTEMTVDQAIQFSDPSGPYAQWVKARIGRVATPMGAYQIVGRTLREAKTALGLRGDEVMTRELQDELGKWIYRTQGTGAWVGYKGPRRTFVPSEGDAPTFSTARGFTRSGQVAADDIRVDVAYEVVDASLLRRASGDLQPRDRSRAASDEQIAEIAARLDPARLLPSPEADRGAPIVAPDGTIESGNARVAAIERAYDMGLDRADAYRQAIEEFTGEAIPEGVDRPVLIARRTSDFQDEGTRQRFTRAANRATTARMSATEQARADAADIAPRAFDAYRPGARLNGPENREFVRRFMSGLPQAERAALVTRDGRLNIDGLRRIRQALFARAFDAEDLLQLVAETENPAVESLLRMLEDLAPDWASFRAMVEAGYIRDDFDITAALMDAVRVIARTRSDARDGQSVIAAIRDALSQGDMFAARDPMVEAIVDVFYKGDRARRPEASGEILARYIAEAAIVGRADIGDLAGEAVTPIAALTRAIEGHEAKTDFRLPGDGEAPSDPDFDVAGVDDTGYGDGTIDPAVARADDAIEAELKADIKPDAAAPNARPRAAEREAFRDFEKAELPIGDGETITVREMLDDLDRDRGLAELMETCRLGSKRQ